MKCVSILALALALAPLLGAAEAASAGTLQASYRHSTGHIHAPRLRHSFRTTHRRPHRIKLVAPHLRTSTLDAPRGFVQVADNDESRDGWFKSQHEAGWGMQAGGTQMVAGLYQRPEHPDIPGPQTLHTPEGRGAAGLSLSLKLGK